MIIMIIHWKIRSDEDSMQQFRKRWSQTDLPNPEHFSGEYLSKPMHPDEAGFPCTTFNVSSDVRYTSFFNVAIWRDVDDFRKDVLENAAADRPEVEKFEFDHRERMVLRPVMSRIGELKLPEGPGLGS